jgi:hypothetical protein
VAAGTYSTGAGETFPLVIPPGVALLGDEANKGAAVAGVIINGGVTGNSAPIHGTLEPGTGATIAGFTLTDPLVGAFRAVIVMMSTHGVIVRNNTFIGSKTNQVIYVSNSSGGHTIANNVFTGQTSSTVLYFGGSGAMCRVEGNVLTNNYVAVELDTAQADFGGGTTGSVGGNTLSCNTYEDLADYAGISTIPAKNNLWDHLPPTVGQTGGGDLYAPVVGQLNVDTTGAALAPSPCP